MDLNHLSVFATVAQTGSFTDAARRLGMPKSTISRIVSSLEASLGVRLLQRTTRSVALTTAGQALVDRVGPRLEALSEAISELPELSDEPSGSLRLTATADFATEVLGEILAGFCRRYPRISLEMHLLQQRVDLVKEGYDAAFRFLARRPRDSTLVARKVGDVNLRFYASPAYLDKRRAPRTPDDLLEHDCAAITGTSPFALDEVSHVRARLRLRIVADDGFFVREIVRHGMGIGLLPTFLTHQDVRDGRLVRVLTRWTVPMGGIYLLYPSARHLPRKTVALRDHVMEALRAGFKDCGTAP
jgi:DNA-binding transcriptional LysR family regulator